MLEGNNCLLLGYIQLLLKWRMSGIYKREREKKRESEGETVCIEGRKKGEENR